jgi:hypothetical protein
MSSTDLEHFLHTMGANQNAFVEKHLRKSENNIYIKKDITNDPIGENADMIQASTRCVTMRMVAGIKVGQICDAITKRLIFRYICHESQNQV